MKALSTIDEDPSGKAFSELITYMSSYVNSAGNHETMVMMKDCLPYQCWSMITDFPALAPIMTQLFKSPASSSGIERQHKVGKHVHSSKRYRLGIDKIEKQVAVTYNTSSMNRVMHNKRHKFEHHLATYFNPIVVDQGEEAGCSSDDEDVEALLDCEMLEARVYEANSIEDISDAMIFGPSNVDIDSE